ncbi:MAG: hypothetical protein ABSE62_02350 [Chthoniobacteraceae bacterium]|jgi:hypothetical protein
MFRLYYLLPLLIPLALVKGNLLGRLFHPLERWGARLAARPARVLAVVAAFSFSLCAALSVIGCLPRPQTHDEFGYLLLGDTFAHGRVTNPTPPLWEHFETIHQIMRPTYTAKYPPAQGLVLALGEKLGLPIIGVWLATALACATVSWMFMAWMPPRWALAGGLMVALHPLILEWGQNYWGGSVALAGGALLLGAFRRILREPRARDAVWMGVGLAILANSRPYEGFVLGLLMMLALVIWYVEAGKVPAHIVIKRVFAPLLGVMALLAVQLGFYNWRVTGDPMVMPYVVHEETYGIAPLFLFGTPRVEPQYRHLQIQRLQEDYLKYFESQRRSFGALMEATGSKIWMLSQGYLWSYLLVVALLGLPWAIMRDRWLWFALFIGLFFSIAMLLGTWVFPHYAAPAAGLFFVLVVESMRSLDAWRVGVRRPGRNIVRGLAILFVISFFQVAVKMAAQDRTRWYFQRAKIIADLSDQPGKSLVIVKYDPDHNPNREWVYNGADLAGEKVIFARNMDARNRELVDYYKDRKAWVLDADAPVPTLQPYPGS